MKTYDLVLLGKAKQGLTSDREFALHNGLSVQNISDWKAERANPNTTNFLILIEAAGLGLSEAMEIAKAMEKRKNLKQAGFGNVVFLSTLSAGSFGAMSIMNMTQLPYEAIGAAMLGASIVYYVKSEGHELSEVKGQLRTLSHEELLKFVAANDIEACQVSTHRIY